MEKKNRYLYYSIFYSCLLLVAIGIYAYGWETPSCDPPGCNLPAPINAGLDPQTKAGNLTIDSLLKVGRYSSAPTGSTGALYYDTTANEFKGYKASSWDSLGGTAPVSSVFGRTGNVTAASGDYSVGNITGAAPLASPTFTGTVSGITKAMVGLGSVDNTADSAKSVNYAATAGSAPKGVLSCNTYSTAGYGSDGITVSCPAGTLCTGGGIYLNNIGNYDYGNITSYPYSIGWYCKSQYRYAATCYARCCKIQ